MAPTNQKVSNHVPDEIVFSIFSKLPLKSINRFTCLGKSWSTLFENPYFINMFYKHIVSKHHSLYDEACLLLNYFDSTVNHMITNFKSSCHILLTETVAIIRP